MELQNLGEIDEEKLFVETGKALLAEGIILRQVGETKTQEGSRGSWKSEHASVTPQTALEGNQPQKDIAQDPHLETPEVQSKGLSPP